MTTEAPYFQVAYHPHFIESALTELWGNPAVVLSHRIAGNRRVYEATDHCGHQAYLSKPSNASKTFLIDDLDLAFQVRCMAYDADLADTTDACGDWPLLSAVAANWDFGFEDDYGAV
jgi:hypothetical protein